MKRKQVFLTLALTPGLLVGAGAKIIGSKSVEQPGFAENAETLGYTTNRQGTEKKKATRSRHRRKRTKSFGKYTVKK